MTNPLLSDIICTILIMSLSGSALILLLFALKPLIRHRLPKSIQYILWIVTLAALIVPVSKIVAIPEAPLNIIIVPIQTAVEQSVFVEKEANAFLQTNTNTNAQTESTDKPPVKSELIRVFTATTVFLWVYVLIVTVVLSYYIFSYIRFTRKVRSHRTRASMEELYNYVGLCGDRIAPRLYRSALTATPILIGIFKPEIILPDREYTDTQIQSVLMHELTHLRRHDVIVKWLSVFACALHWFNPLVWLARREIDRICELSCDDAVIRHMDHEGKQSYGETLIFVAADTKVSHAVLSTTMCEEKEGLKERLSVIMKYQKRTWITLVISTIMMTAAVCAVFVMGAGTAPLSASGENIAGAVTSDTSLLTQPHSPAGEVIEFKDPVVEKVIRATLKKPEGPITDYDMLKVEKFEFNEIKMNMYCGRIKTIDDLSRCKNLKTLSLSNTDITDITALSSMRNLEYVYIFEKIDDFTPLLSNKNLIVIQLTGVSDNFFRELIKNCSKLTAVHLEKSDVSPENLRLLATNFKLDSLALNYCYIDDSDLTYFLDFKGLSSLSLEYNYIKDISVFTGHLELFENISLCGNQITDWSPLEGMTSLTFLQVYGNPITDSPALDKLEEKGCEILR